MDKQGVHILGVEMYNSVWRKQSVPSISEGSRLKKFHCCIQSLQIQIRLYMYSVSTTFRCTCTKERCGKADQSLTKPTHTIGLACKKLTFTCKFIICYVIKMHHTSFLRCG